MDVRVGHGVDGAISAKGIAVVIDVFRASNTIISCFEQGADCIIPVDKLEEAYKLKEKNPSYLLVGERQGLIPNGFDYGNSPTVISKMNLSGKTIIFTSSAGSKGLVHASNANEILVGSFANAKAITKYIRGNNPEMVSLLALGLNGKEKAVEDEVFAKYLKNHLNGNQYLLEDHISEILEGEGTARLKRLNQIDDLKYCLKENISEVVPGYNKKTGEIINIK